MLYAIVRIIGRGHPNDRRPGMRLGAYPGPLQIETPFAIPDTTQAPFRDDMALPDEPSQTNPILRSPLYALRRCPSFK
ncbi:MAG: hypothetical protein WBS14_17115, partial [Rhodomicrobium sp.]